MYAYMEVNDSPEVLVVESFTPTGGGWCAAVLRSSYVNDGQPFNAAIKTTDIEGK